TDKVRSIGDPLAAPFADRMIGYDLSGMTHDDAPGKNHDRDRLADQPPGDGITVGVEVDRTIGPYLADEIAELAEGRAAPQGPKRARLQREAHDRRLAGRAMDATIGDLPGPVL